jgi:hypothetical protein
MVTIRRSFLAPAACLPLVFSWNQFVLIQRGNAQVVAVAVEASVIVEGRVTNTFQSDDESLVQLLVLKAELAGIANAARASYPAPGEYVYVHLGTKNSPVSQFGRRVGSERLPNSQSIIRASLKMDASGQWSADGSDWFQSISQAENQSSVSRPPAGRGGAVTLGLVTQRVKLGREMALKVVSVTPNSPAAAAGIEPGDTLVQVNRQPVESEEKLEEVFRGSVRGISLTVRDIRSGRDVEVDVQSAGRDALVPRTGEMRSLGVASKLAFYSGEPALEITSVEPGSPAQRAGLATGLLITKANGKAVSSQEELGTAERESQGRLQLTIVDPKDRRERNVTEDLN